jgi:hypothetical protein
VLKLIKNIIIQILITCIFTSILQNFAYCDTLAYSSIFIDNKITTYQEYNKYFTKYGKLKTNINLKQQQLNHKKIPVLSNIKSVFKTAWKQKKWECFGLPIYILLLGAVLISIFLLNPPLLINASLISAVTISTTIVTFALVWSIVMRHTSLKKYPILKQIPKIIALLITVIGTFVFSSQISAILVAGYIMVDIFTYSLNLISLKDKITEKPNKAVTGVLFGLYITYFAAKIATITSPLVAAFIVILVALAITSYIIYSKLKNSKNGVAKHIFRCVFQLLSIGFILSGIKAHDMDAAYSSKAINSLLNTFIEISDHLVRLGLVLNFNIGFNKFMEYFTKIIGNVIPIPPSYDPNNNKVYSSDLISSDLISNVSHLYFYSINTSV